MILKLVYTGFFKIKTCVCVSQVLIFLSQAVYLNMQGLFVPFAYAKDLVILLWSYVYFTTNIPDTIEAVIAETMYNLSLLNLKNTYLENTWW